MSVAHQGLPGVARQAGEGTCRYTYMGGALHRVEFFKSANIEFLGKKWYFIAFSLIFSVAGVLSMLFWHGIPLGVDFRGGTLVYVKFAHTPDTNNIHEAMRKAGLPNARIQTYGAVSNNEVL